VVAYAGVLAAWGGDGMPGRWLALPFLVSMLLVVRRVDVSRPFVFGLAAAAALALAAVPARLTLQSDVRFGTDAQRADAGDPRGTDYPATGLLHDIRQWYPPTHPEARRGGVVWQDTNRVRTSPHPAFFGIAAGYGVHVIDPKGRTDPLLARLPPTRPASVGAGAARAIPDGYEASLPDKENAVVDPAVATYYDRVRFVTRGPLGSLSRLLAAVELSFARPPEARMPNR
jgi:arabinofuranosyltransferase